MSCWYIFVKEDLWKNNLLRKYADFRTEHGTVPTVPTESGNNDQ
jgi:hypothetical protein